MTILSDFKKLLPKASVTDKPWKGPLYWLWVFDPMSGKVVLDHNKDRPRAKAITHQDMAPEIVHPERLHGYVYKIQGGYRITTDEHKMVEDPFVKKQIEKALREVNPPKSLPKLGTEAVDA